METGKIPHGVNILSIETTCSYDEGQNVDNNSRKNMFDLDNIEVGSHFFNKNWIDVKIVKDTLHFPRDVSELPQLDNNWETIKPGSHIVLLEKIKARSITTNLDGYYLICLIDGLVIYRWFYRHTAQLQKIDK